MGPERIFEQLSQLNEQLLSLQQALAGRDAELECAKTELAHARELVDTQNAALLAANAQLAGLATLDGLTGVKNRRAFDERLAEELRRAERHQQPLSLVLLDVDHFKPYNDAYGHLAGDDALRAVSGVLQHQARSTDFVARYGGEEFVVLLPNTGVDEARRAAARLRQAFADKSWPDRPVTASFGVATVIGKTMPSEDLIRQADQALYRSKAEGRNRATHFVDLGTK
jgi:diguanylate cyclase (GGDEF)-like protein